MSHCCRNHNVTTVTVGNIIDINAGYSSLVIAQVFIENGVLDKVAAYFMNAGEIAPATRVGAEGVNGPEGHIERRIAEGRSAETVGSDIVLTSCLCREADDGFQLVACVERILVNRVNRGGNGDVGQRGTPIERIGCYVFHRVGHDHAFQAGAVAERLVTDSGDGIGRAAVGDCGGNIYRAAITVVVGVLVGHRGIRAVGGVINAVHGKVIGRCAQGEHHTGDD